MKTLDEFRQHVTQTFGDSSWSPPRVLSDDRNDGYETYRFESVPPISFESLYRFAELVGTTNITVDSDYSLGYGCDSSSSHLVIDVRLPKTAA